MLSSNNCMLSSTQPNSSSKFGGSTFSITRHKKVDLSALEEAHAEVISDARDVNISHENAAIERTGQPKFESYDVLEKTAAIVFEQVRHDKRGF